ncbi:MAG: fructosamine kinase family protein [Thiohalomonadaceae bacterium]
MMPKLWQTIAADISAAQGTRFVPRHQYSVSGGCINAAHVLDDGKQRWFVKLNDAARLDMFVAEAAGLRELAAAKAVRVPRPLCHGLADGQAYLVLEWLDLTGSADDELLGRQLAAMHQVSRPEYGWQHDNTIGSTPQPNTQCMEWLEFLRKYRLGHQLELLRQSHMHSWFDAAEELLASLLQFFVGYMPVASLLHGDLWAGNVAFMRTGEPVIFDPAVYYGDREADLAMTELFGGFAKRFYAAYQEVWPLDAGYKVRKRLYNLYHVLNHYYMFGGGYGQQAARMIEQLLSELR